MEFSDGCQVDVRVKQIVMGNYFLVVFFFNETKMALQGFGSMYTVLLRVTQNILWHVAVNPGQEKADPEASEMWLYKRMLKIMWRQSNYSNILKSNLSLTIRMS